MRGGRERDEKWEKGREMRGGERERDERGRKGEGEGGESCLSSVLGHFFHKKSGNF